MSSDRQNPRSPDQQFESIENEMKRQRLKWRIIDRYRDDAKSGRLVSRRRGLQKMLSDIRSGAICVDLVLVDTHERLGRSDSLPGLIKELRELHGVLILTADSRFSDPTSRTGRIFGAFESIRAVEENTVKAYHILRGKKDTVRQGYWPGGNPPLGLQLESVFGMRDGREEKLGSKLIPSPDTLWITQELFSRAESTGEGQTRLARYLTDHPDIPPGLKPFFGSTVGDWLDNELYVGQFIYPKRITDIIDDTYIRQLVAEEETEVFENYCTAIIPREQWDAVQLVRNARRELNLSRQSTRPSEKQIAPIAPGLSLKYLLSGLLRCGHCGAAMRPGGTSRDRDPEGKYVYYRCPRNVDGACPNNHSVPELWIRTVVIEQLRQRLFSSGLSLQSAKY